MKIKKLFVKSSSVDAVGYDKKSKTLRIWFHEGSAYDYYNVPKTKFEAIFKVPSIGAFVNQEIKGFYDYSLANSKVKIQKSK